MTDISLLPSSATDLQHALALTTAKATDLNHNVIRDSRDPLICDVDLLPWLAWENSIDDAEGWVFAEGETEKRALIANYIRKHEFKGTPASIRQLFRDLGLGEIDIIEDVGKIRYDGKVIHDGTYLHGSTGSTWATYNIIVKEQPITNDQADFLKTILKGIAPARCELRQIIYTRVAIRHNNVAMYDGTYNYGAVDG
ncbi:phage tail protein I [Vitreoscilla massiliensis]|uniref:Phage tail protein I n=1 Tax=Vitreoscilla massiliensis TaxID=1689272 RepID=A0ABY4E4K5_9NEIS|nr:phage tail protein I [Vitreoscilla massiliensis]UOO90268.1 phage tail protein I [Vitreoscilla massiliensis]